MLNHEITQKAREILKGNWTKTLKQLSGGFALIFVVNLLIRVFPVRIVENAGQPLIAALIDFLVSALVIFPLLIGFTRKIIGIGKGREVDNKDLYISFKDKGYLKDACVYGVASVLVLSLYVISSCIAAIAGGVAGSIDPAAYLATNAILFVIFIGVLSFFAVPYLTMLYFTVSDKRDLNLFQCYQHAFALTRGNVFKFWRLNGRFVGWWLLAIIPIGLAALLADFAGFLVFVIAIVIMAIIAVRVALYECISNVVLYDDVEQKSNL